MKISSTSVAALATLYLPTYTTIHAQEECLTGGFKLEFDGQCTPELILAAYEDVYNAPGAKADTCTTSAKDDLLLKTGTPDLQPLCDALYDTQDRVPFTMAANRGTDLHQFEQMFYNGLTDWQDEVQTKYEDEDEQQATSILKLDAERVRVFFDGIAQGQRVEWPGELPNFHNNEYVSGMDGDLATCETNAAMCCWPKDRQANDNNGNCASPYDTDCVDKDVADNTNLCFVDPERSGALGMEFTDPEDVLVYPGDGNNGEGAIHCHGLAWSDDVNDATARYKANNLFFVSMYDHMYQRGYVKNIPGAPMCGCVEQMPTVSRSDCTQVDLTEKNEIEYNGSEFTSKITYVDVNFNACRGINNRNNDLWAYMARLYYQGDISPEQFGKAGRIITNTGCSEATKYELNKKFLTPGYDHDTSTWTNVAGRESMDLHARYGHRAFNLALSEGASSAVNNTHHGIIYRTCRTCIQSHMKIYYRRRTPVPDDLDLLGNILYYGNQDGGIWSVDFSLHSTLDDALNDKNPWKCPNNAFNYGAPFYGECSPEGNRVRDQYSKFQDYNHKNDVGYFVNKAEDVGPITLETTKIQGRDYADGIALQDPETGTIYMTGSGRDIWGQNDDFNYYDNAVEGDHTIIVHASDISSIQPHEWSKSGVMFRAGLEPNDAHFSIFLTGGRRVCVQGRWSKNAGSSSGGNCLEGYDDAWLKVERRIDTLTAFVGSQEVEGGPITWTSLYSRELGAALGDSYYAGLAISSARWYQQEVVFSDYELDAYYFPSAAPSTSAAPTAFIREGAVLDHWFGIDGGSTNYLVGDARYPDSPDDTTIVKSLEGPTNFADRYGSRLQAYIVPPVTCDWNFYIASDDNSQLHLSTDDHPANKTQVAYVRGWTSSRQWNKYGEEQKGTRSLEAGKFYYLEAIQKEGGGGDNLAVAWECISSPTNQTIALEVIGGEYIQFPGTKVFQGVGDFTL